MSTVVEPIITWPGPAGMHPGNRHGIVMEVTVAAGRLPMSTVGAPGGMISSGNPGCGSGVGVGAGGCIGAWQCGMLCNTMSVTRAAGGTSELSTPCGKLSRRQGAPAAPAGVAPNR